MIPTLVLVGLVAGAALHRRLPHLVVLLVALAAVVFALLWRGGVYVSSDGVSEERHGSWYLGLSIYLGNLVAGAMVGVGLGRAFSRSRPAS